MTGSASTATAASPRAGVLMTGFLWLVCCAVSAGCWAGRPVRVYEVDLNGGQTPAALQDAMRQALVRATGRREAAGDPVFAALITNAPNFVKAYASGPHGEPQVIFDGPAVERAITAAGRDTWGRDRPFTLVVLSPAPPRASEDLVRASLEQAATERGLPISLVPLALTDPSGTELGRDALMQTARRYGGDAVLVGRGDPGVAGGQFQWTLYTALSSENWSGPLAAGIDGAVAQFAPLHGGLLSPTELPAIVQIDGLNSLVDFAEAQRMLESVPGARRVNVAAASGSSASFEVNVRGGAEALEHVLTASGRFVRSGVSGARLVLQYRPQ